MGRRTVGIQNYDKQQCLIFQENTFSSFGGMSKIVLTVVSPLIKDFLLSNLMNRSRIKERRVSTIKTKKSRCDSENSDKRMEEQWNLTRTTA